MNNVPTHHYNPAHLLNALQNQLNLHSEAALSKVLKISRELIVQMRERRRPVAGALLIRMHEVSQRSVADLRDLMGDRRRTCRMPLRINLSGRRAAPALKKSLRRGPTSQYTT